MILSTLYIRDTSSHVFSGNCTVLPVTDILPMHAQTRTNLCRIDTHTHTFKIERKRRVNSFKSNIDPQDGVDLRFASPQPYTSIRG